jgi:hypothetical protein
MIFPTALVLALLSITPVLSIPTDADSNTLVARAEPFSLDLEEMLVEKRGIDEENFEQLVARSPLPEPEPAPEPFPLPATTAMDIEDMERRGIFGIGFKVAKVLGKAAWNYYKSKHHKRDDLAEDGSMILKRDDLVEILKAREFDDLEFHARAFDDEELEARAFDEEMEIEARSFDEPEIEERSFDEGELEELD